MVMCSPLTKRANFLTSMCLAFADYKRHHLLRQTKQTKAPSSAPVLNALYGQYFIDFWPKFVKMTRDIFEGLSGHKSSGRAGAAELAGLGRLRFQKQVTMTERVGLNKLGIGTRDN